MNWAAECVVVIPCLNEEKSIDRVVRAAREFLPRVIVVDDGSTDASARFATQAGAEFIRHDTPQGKGAALIAGWKRAAELGFAWALTMDGDGQHNAKDIPTFLAAAKDGEVDLVVGNRFASDGQMPWLRRKVNHWMSRRLSRAAGIALPDSQCGFRLMRLDAWKKVDLRTRHFEIESEMLLKFASQGFKIAFVPVQTIYRDECSKINPWRDTLRWFSWWRQRNR